MSFSGLSLPNRILKPHSGKGDNSRQVSGTSDASKTQLRLIGSCDDSKCAVKQQLCEFLQGRQCGKHNEVLQPASEGSLPGCNRMFRVFSSPGLRFKG